MKALLTILLVLATALSFGQSCQRTVNWGNTSYCLPKIAGFTESYTDPLVNELAESTRHGQNTILGAYLLTDELREFKAGNQAILSEYFRIEAATQTKDVGITQKEFDEFCVLMSQQLESDEQLAELVQKAEAEFDVASFSSPVKIDEYSPSTNSKTYVVINSLEMDGTKVIQICTMNLLRLKNRILFLYYYNDYKGKESIQQAKSQSDFIVLRIAESNK